MQPWWRHGKWEWSCCRAVAIVSAAAAPAAMAVPTSNDTVCESILNAIFDKYLYSSRPEERCAACTWLLALVTHTRRHEKLVSMLPEIQEAFGSLLGDQNELTQEEIGELETIFAHAHKLEAKLLVEHHSLRQLL